MNKTLVIVLGVIAFVYFYSKQNKTKIEEITEPSEVEEERRIVLDGGGVSTGGDDAQVRDSQQTIIFQPNVISESSYTEVIQNTVNEPVSNPVPDAISLCEQMGYVDLGNGRCLDGNRIVVLG